MLGVGKHKHKQADQRSWRAILSWSSLWMEDQFALNSKNRLKRSFCRKTVKQDRLQLRQCLPSKARQCTSLASFSLESCALPKTRDRFRLRFLRGNSTSFNSKPQLLESVSSSTWLTLEADKRPGGGSNLELGPVDALLPGCTVSVSEPDNASMGARRFIPPQPQSEGAKSLANHKRHKLTFEHMEKTCNGVLHCNAHEVDRKTWKQSRMTNQNQAGATTSNHTKQAPSWLSWPRAKLETK